MELNFLGRGSAFNPKEGNTSAYFKSNEELFLIDCGESVFAKLIENKLLDNTTNTNLMITHTHSDHVGSLGSLVMYSFYTLNKPLNIILPSNESFQSNIIALLKCFGCTDKMYKLVNEKEFDKKYEAFQNIRFINTTHSKELDCFSIVFSTANGIVYYSGDTNEINFVKSLIIKGIPIDKLYIDTTTANYPGNVHLNIDTLYEIIPESLRNRVYCMHLNDDNCIKKAETYGFNVVIVNDYVQNKKR